MLWPKSTSRRLAVAAATLAAVGALSVPALASAASVEVRESATEERATLEFRGDAGGDVVALSTVNLEDVSSFYEVKLVNSSAGIVAGAHCSGENVPNKPVTCQLRRPTAGWTTNVELVLGAGANSLDARELNVNGPELVRAQIGSGNGDDTIRTGNTYDLIEPGGGDDEVQTGDGNDGILAAAGADGDDVFDLGGGFDQVSYARRAAAVKSDGASAGSAGERDQMAGVEALIGGSGDDSLVGSETTRTLDGGPGNDTLSGGDEDNFLYGGLGNDTLAGNGGGDALVGSNGDDSMSAGDANDNIKELLQEGESNHLWYSPTIPQVSSGADFADGGGGSDLIELGPGPDHALGGPGVDVMRGGPENDELDGGDGDDGISGEAGADRLIGGNGFDEILAGRLFEPRFDSVRPVDSSRDSIDCGPNQDVVLLNRWDAEVGCEYVRLIRAVEPRPLKRNLKRGTARLPVNVVGPGTLAGLGSSIEKFGRQVKTTQTEARTGLVLPIVARGGAKKKLERTGRVTVHFWLRYRPSGGVGRSEPIALTLVGPRPPKPKKTPQPPKK